MANFQKKPTSTNLWHSPLMLFVIFCVVLIFMYNMIGIVDKANDTRKKTAVVRSQITELSAREETLSSDIANLKTEQGVEETLRDKYQLVKSGEKMVVIVDQEASANQVIPEKPKGKSFKEFFRDLFKKK
jgi:cell division protein FtsB